MGPSQFWDKLFRTQTDSKYYMGKTEDLVQTLTEDVAEYEINKVTVFDLVDEENKTPILGEYISTRIVEAITKSKTAKEARSLYETLKTTVGTNNNKKAPKSLSESVSRKSNLSAILPRRKQAQQQPANDFATRMQTLAGIK